MLRPFTLVVAVSASALTCRPGSQASQSVESPDAGGDAGVNASDGGQSAGGGVDGGAIPPRPVGEVGCGSWILEQPLPQAYSLRAAWALANDDMWAVGEKGAIVRWNGSSLANVDSPTGGDLSTVWGADAKHVWAGGATLLTFDGVAWHEVPAPAPHGADYITGSAVDDVWVWTERQGIHRWDGTRWTQPGDTSDRPPATADFFQGGAMLWAAGGGRAWTGGCTGELTNNATPWLYFWDGAHWTRTNPDVSGCIFGIAGTAPDDVWAASINLTQCGTGHCGVSYATLHWDGVRWSQASTGLPIAGPFFSPAPGEVWFFTKAGADSVVARRQGGAFHAFLSLSYLGPSIALAAVSPTDVFIAGTGGLIAHSDGTTTKLLNGPNFNLTALWGDASGDAWAVGTWGTVLRRHDSRWSSVDLGMAGIDPVLSSRADFWAASASSLDNLWMAGGDLAVHWDGHAFTQSLAPSWFEDVWVSPSGRALFAGGDVYRADATGFTPVVTGINAKSIWGTAETDLWFVGGDGSDSTLVHFDGTSVVEAARVPWSIDGWWKVRGNSASDIWATARGALLHFDGVSWRNAKPSSAPAYDVTVAGPNDVWVESGDGAWRFDGSSWTVQEVPPGRIFVAGGAVYSLGGWGRICRKP